MISAFADASETAIPLHVIEKNDCEGWLEGQSDLVKTWVTMSGFQGSIGDAVVVPDENGAPALALAGYGTPRGRLRGRFHLAAAAGRLPKGVYKIASGLPDDALEVEVLGWLMHSYRFDRYRKKTPIAAQLQCPESVDRAKVEALLAGEVLARDLINTPANDMGPDALESAARELAETFGASCSVIEGEALLSENFPLIHTVGRAADRAPRLIDMAWGKKGPKITLVGKGVCFDTGGLNLKPGASMGMMKKDMGGAANVLGLAHMLMATGQQMQLRVLIPAVENSVSGSAFRPGDVLTSRKGLTIEINNTDAEGRLVLADALALAQEDKPDLIVSMATLTGAARIAVGSDLAPYYCDGAKLVAALETAAEKSCDPVWRMPFHTPYEPKIEPAIADLDNAPSGGFAGSITAALFLRRFVGDAPYIHFDIFGWSSTNAPARPKGGSGQGIRALFDVLRSFDPKA